LTAGSRVDTIYYKLLILLVKEPNMPLNRSKAKRGSVEKPLEFLYLDQEAVLAAGVLDMRRAMKVVGEARVLFALGQVREPSNQPKPLFGAI
jgi:hypothetical protein